MDTIEKMIKKYAAFGQQKDGSVSRTFGSHAYREAALALKEEMQQSGLDSYIDAVGNVHGIYDSNGEACQEVLIGSHLDTVESGGMFDGLYGILAGLLCVKRFRENQMKLPFRLHLIAANGEEGNILGGTFGSRCLTGGFTEKVLSSPEFVEKLKGIVVNPETQEELSAESIHSVQMDFHDSRYYLEVHIEQGSSLEKEKKQIGIVTGIVGLQRYRICVHGKRNHSGTTKMEYREDALVKAAQLIVFADALARQYQHDFVATFETVRVLPNALAVINDEVEMVLEIRNLSEPLMQKYMKQIARQCRELDNIELEQIVAKKPVLTDTGIQQKIRQVCAEQRISCQQMPSGATHDGNMFARQIPVGMIFVPSKGGISHNRQEWTDWKDCETGVQVLYETILKLAAEDKLLWE